MKTFWLLSLVVFVGGCGFDPIRVEVTMQEAATTSETAKAQSEVLTVLLTESFWEGVEGSNATAEERIGRILIRQHREEYDAAIREFVSSLPAEMQEKIMDDTISTAELEEFEEAFAASVDAVTDRLLNESINLRP